jgi:hypothetical protein
MNAITLSLPYRSLAALSFLASTDETRQHICCVNMNWRGPTELLLVATDGRRIGFLRQEPTEPVAEFAPFSITTELIRLLDRGADLRILHELADRHGMEYWDEPALPDPNAQVSVRCDVDAGVVSLTLGRITYQESLVRTAFPDVRSVLLTASAAPLAREHVTINPRLLADFSKVADALGCPNCGTALTMVGSHDAHSGVPAVIRVTLPETSNFFGCLMPIRQTDESKREQVGEVPAWLKLES